MVAGQPDPGQVFKAPVLSDVRGQEMAVIIDDRQGLREAVVKLRAEAIPQHEIFVDERAGHVGSPAARA